MAPLQRSVAVVPETESLVVFGLETVGEATLTVMEAVLLLSLDSETYESLSAMTLSVWEPADNLFAAMV